MSGISHELQDNGAGEPAAGLNSDPRDPMQQSNAALAALAELSAGAIPPVGLFDAIEAEIDAAPTRTFETRRAEESDWVQRTEKIWQKIILDDHKTERRIYFLRCAPGAVIKAHHHERDEHVLVLEGSFQIEGVTVRTGDSQYSRAGTLHAEITSPEGCLLLLHA